MMADGSDLLADLFVRVGFFVSRADDTDDGQRSEKLELKNMHHALSRVEAVAKQAVIAKAAAKAREARTVPEPEDKETLATDIARVVQMFKDGENLNGLREFHKALMYTGTMIARAYREELDHHEDEFMLESLLNKWSGDLNQDADPEEFKNANVSPMEEAALDVVSKALRS